MLARTSHGDCKLNVLSGFRDEEIHLTLETRRFESGIGVKRSGLVRRGREGNWFHFKWEGLAWSKSVMDMVMEINWID